MDFQTFDCLPEDKILEGILSVHNLVFESELQLVQEIGDKKDLLIQVATKNNQVVGYKIGYQRKKGHFYSWLGAVHPDYRNLGIASELMKIQHQYCIQHAYKTVRTHTKNKWREMLVLNLKHGFDVIGTFTDDMGETKIILQKTL